MKGKLNPRQRKFALLIVSGMSATEAYKKAGFKGSQCNASQLGSKRIIKNEIERLEKISENKVFDLKKYCQNFGPEVIDELLTVARNWNYKGSNSDKVSALRELLDRGFGTPTQTIESTIEDRKILEIVIQTPDGIKTVAKRIFPKS